MSGSDIAKAISVPAAVTRLRETLEGGLDPENDGLRNRLATYDGGQFLQMPSTSGQYTGTKLLTISPGNASSGLPVIQGIYALFGGPDQRPLAILDGRALTNLRTPAVSALGALHLASSEPQRLLVFGTGPQAWEHIKAFNSVFALTGTGIVGRNQAAAQVLAARASAIGIEAEVATTDQVSEADIIICCTASANPLFDGSLVRETSVVVSMGSHEPESRELDDVLMSRASICVESLQSSQREAGEIIQAMASGAITGPDQLITLADLVCGRRSIQEGRPAVFKTTGMPWQDLAIAAAAFEIHSAETRAPSVVRAAAH
ncbi:ornithine cyclodeaminase family protein [Paenarthrobacter sp. NPDC058040]|uniref:ornithine cyclodeaminase family protein n=1 Tax=unclassified Paenarthrobacter TaxID=2634190 RepID=UPI0036DDA93B